MAFGVDTGLGGIFSVGMAIAQKRQFGLRR
jgi:hypothetical protein